MEIFLLALSVICQAAQFVFTFFLMVLLWMVAEDQKKKKEAEKENMGE